MLVSDRGVDPFRQYEPPPQVAEVVGQHAELQADLVRTEAVTRQPCPVRRLLAFLDPLLGRAALVVKPHDGVIGELEIRHDEADAREQLAGVMLDFRHDPSGGGPAVRLIMETLVADERLATGPTRRPEQDVFDQVRIGPFTFVFRVDITPSSTETEVSTTLQSRVARERSVPGAVAKLLDALKA